MRWYFRHRQEARPIQPSSMVNPRHAELDKALEILAEIFGIRAVEVEEIIQMRLEERRWSRHIKRRMECGLRCSAWWSSYGQEL